jgi:hypothetical protein
MDYREDEPILTKHYLLEIEYKMMKKISIILLLAGMAVSNLQSATLIDWGGTGMASSDTNFSLPTPTDNGNTRTWAYSASTPLLSTGGNYSGPTIYGALQTGHTSSGPNNFTPFVDDRGGSDDRITTLVNTATTGDLIRGLVFFQKSDFLNGSTSTLTFDSSSSATLSVIGNNGAGGPRGPRLAVLDGSSWYVSSSFFGGFSGDLVFSDLSTATFGAYDPTGAPLNGTPGSFSTTGGSFTDIQAVGYYFDLGNPAGTSGSAGMSIDIFQISAVPEPSTALLLLGGLAGLALLRRRK